MCHHAGFPVIFFTCTTISLLGGGTFVNIKEQLIGVGSHLPPCGSWGSNSGHQARQQELLPTELSCQTPNNIFFNLHFFVCVGCQHATGYVWTSEDNLWNQFSLSPLCRFQRSNSGHPTS